MSAGLICAVHGFLGQASDWNLVEEHLNSRDICWHKIDLFKPNQMADLEFKKAQQYKGKKIFVGYSLGGRLGLMFLNKNANLFDHYFFISTNAGMPNEAIPEREHRKIIDQQWADKISEFNWQNFISEWNQQPVFTGSKKEPVRLSSQYDLLKLKQALINWSLADQPNFESLIQEHQSKLTWVVGAQDQKYLLQAENLKTKGILKDFVQLPTGHRVHLDCPQNLAQLIANKV